MRGLSLSRGVLPFSGHTDGLFPVGGSFFEGLTQTALILMHDGSILIPKGAVAERQ